MSDTQTPAAPTDDPRIAAALDNWKRKLLDLSKRNRALNFRMTRASTVAIVDEQPAEVFRRLYLQEKRMRFAAAQPPAPASPETAAADQSAFTSPVIAPSANAVAADTSSNTPPPSTAPAQGDLLAQDDAPPAASPDAAETPDVQPNAVRERGLCDVPAANSFAPDSFAPDQPADATPDSADVVGDGTDPSAFDDLAEDDEALAAAAEFAPYAAEKLAAKHRDDVLQTTSPPDRLDLSLRRIEEQARETQEEQGVNTLFLTLGMLHYRQSKDSGQVFRAPLVLLPVALTRASAGAGYTVSVTDDDYILNPALAEYLRRDFGVALPLLPDPAEIPDDYDLQRFLGAVTDAVKNQAGWQVTTEIYLGLFAFQKFVMYKDLEANGGAFAAHRLVRRLVTRTGEGFAALPDDVREMELDVEFPPEATAQVVDADSSQLRAIAAVSRGHDLVLEGPPGTGKSQTITNLIAQALNEGQSVLFVAEKMAALSVVHERLVRAGLGDFCLEMHSTKANKRAVVKEIARSLDASLQHPKPGESVAGRLAGVRHTLTEYAGAVHTPFGAAGFTPYRGFGELMALREAPRLKLETPITTVTREEFDEAVRALADLAKAAEDIGDVRNHPWRDSRRTLWSEDELDDARTLIGDLRASLAQTMEHAAVVSSALRLSPLRTFADVDTAVRVGAVLARSPGAPLGVLTSAEWNAPPRQAVELIARGRRVSELDRRLTHWFTADALARDHAAEAQYMEEKEASPFRFLNFLSGRHRATRRRWMGYRQPSYTGSMVEQAAEMRRIDELRRERTTLEALDAVGRELFGALWQGEMSDWDALDGYVRWVVEYRTLCVESRLAEAAAELATRPRPDVSFADALRTASEAATRALTGLRTLAGWPADYLQPAPLAEIAGRAAALGRVRAGAGVAGASSSPALVGEGEVAGQ
ncbi:MAG TPA: DUF4011 domain-containing protein, partial [Longimicrobium sp.]|nr:DUF4011 domain-containing protein [Longimicrobium sp.]